MLLLLGLVYPYAGGYARTGGYANAPTLDGLKWLKSRSPGDPGAIAWIRDNTPGDAVVLEAVGDDYSAFGHARISTFTGRPTVMGWQGHEVQWQHDPGTRGADVQQLYKTTDLAAARALIDRYGIRYVVVGPIEQTSYGDAGTAKWDQLGERVYSSQGTTVWDYTRLLDAEPFLHPAGVGPRLALGDVAEEGAGAHRAGARLVGGLDDPVVAHPPDAELELAAVVAVERGLAGGSCWPR